MTEEARAALAETSTEGLLTTAYALTHRIHAAMDLGIGESVVTLREQRDAITAEVLRRTGDR